MTPDRDIRSSVHPASSVLGVFITGLCALLGIAIVTLFALAAENWVRDHITDRRVASAAAPVEQEATLPTPAIRPIPPPDPRLANARLRGNPALAFNADSYPADAVRRAEEGRVVAKLQVDASGTPTSCVVKTSSGTDSLDRATCAVAMRNVRFDPARDVQGVAIGSSFTLPVRWVLPDQSASTPAEPVDRSAFWIVPLFFAFAGYEGFALRRGLVSGRMSAPKSGQPADRAKTPTLFALYAVIHGMIAIGAGGAGLWMLFDHLARL